MIRLAPSTWVVVHAPSLWVGSVELITSPAWSPATQNEVVGQDTASTTTPGLTLTFDHVLAPRATFVDISRLPLPSPATHSDFVGHETAASQLPGSTNERFQVVAPPVGLVEVKTLPPASTATHSPIHGHETDCI
jgi:hypothetical protein